MAGYGARQVAIAAIAIGGSVGPGAQNQQPAPMFRSEIDYVQIPVRVLDARGDFVRSLTQSDFQILEDGQLQTIATFSAVDIPSIQNNDTIGRAPWRSLRTSRRTKPLR